MTKGTVFLKGKLFLYDMKKSRNARGLTVTIHPGGGLQVTANPWIPKFFINQFLESRAEWILKKVTHQSQFKPTPPPRISKAQYERYKQKALELANFQVEHFAKIYGVKYGKISIRNQKSRWGSCTKKGNLSFNYRIALLAKELSDYIIIHEVCHLKEFNHSQKFWDLVSQCSPHNYALRRQLRRQGMNLD